MHKHPLKTLAPLCAGALTSLILLSSAATLDAQAPAPPPIPTTPAQEEAHPPSIPLWSAGAPGFEARKDEAERVDWRQEPDIVFPVTFNIHNPSITPFLPPADRATGAAIIIAPGGGHMFLTMDREGYDAGQWFADHGVAAFVLKYRLAHDKAGGSVYRVDVEAQADGLRALRLVRSRAAEWRIDPNRIGILGFSAGGEVAALAGIHYDAGKPDSADPVERESSKPDYMALIYPGLPQSLKVDKNTPQTFLACAYDDRPTMSDGLANLYIALHRAGVNAELHIYNRGGHGFGVRPRSLAVTGWTSRVLEWMVDRGLLRSGGPQSPSG
jgi:acetyl esterase/lipase